MQKLSNDYVKGLSEPGKYRDPLLKGFGVRVSKTGRKTYFVENTIKGSRKSATVTVGNALNLNAQQARRKAQEILLRMASGENPNQEKRQKEEEKTRLRDLSLERVFGDYCESRKLKESTKQIYKYVIDAKLKSWKAKPLADISKLMAEKKHRELTLGSPASADHAFRILRALFNYAIDTYEDESGHPLIQLNPIRRLNHTKQWNKPPRRRTVIKEQELAAWFDGVEKVCTQTVRCYLLFVLFTGLRKNEAAKLKWSDVDFERSCFKVPETKNGLAHELPLTNQTKHILKAMQSEKLNIFVFPGHGAESYLKDSRCQIQAAGTESSIKFTIHYLRYTFTSIAARIGIPPMTIKALLNHKTLDVTDGYYVDDAEDLREPLQRVNDRIEELLCCKELVSE